MYYMENWLEFSGEIIATFACKISVIWFIILYKHYLFVCKSCIW